MNWIGWRNNSKDLHKAGNSSYQIQWEMSSFVDYWVEYSGVCWLNSYYNYINMFKKEHRLWRDMEDTK